MEERKFSINGVFQKSKEYIDTRFKLFKLKLVERSSRLIASLIVDVVKTVFAIFVIFFLSLALGFYLSELLGSSSLGFLATGGIFIVLIVLISAFEDRLERLFMNLSIKRFLQKWNDEIDEDDEEGKQD
ncbi:phage holin family protein [Parapedobacter indicus]|uniref:Putative Holin-X, holin superfamily III n=1 Tax=Parapedobacter indicus TaxID=1477437 RepID=A0A1I3KY98_9SPHI|nr:phage holin family protein [Parapedobacter indicus]PPL01957.1 putative superfamily III holin-X [Parapedobacter indicus]SFI77364.1 Putative Holin-X, holin superfamily III [Parapedobacter indicus]